MLTKIIETFTGGFTQMISASIDAIKSGFASFLWEDPTADVLELSSVAEWSLVFVGIGAAIGIVKLVMHIVRG
jgi:hypothetical protein